MPVKPITPEEAEQQQGPLIPDVVIEVFNRLIVSHLRKGVARFKQREVLEALSQKGIAKDTVITNHWLDIEPLYEPTWIVEYDGPAGNEPAYDPIFTFTKR